MQEIRFDHNLYKISETRQKRNADIEYIILCILISYYDFLTIL